MFPGRSIPEMLKRRCWLLLDYISFFWLKNHIFLAANQTFAGGFQFYCWSYYDIILKSMKFVAFTNSKKGGKKKPYEPQSGQFPQQFPIKSQQIPIKSQEITSKVPSNHNKFRRNSHQNSHQIPMKSQVLR